MSPTHDVGDFAQTLLGLVHLAGAQGITFRAEPLRWPTAARNLGARGPRWPSHPRSGITVQNLADVYMRPTRISIGSAAHAAGAWRFRRRCD